MHNLTKIKLFRLLLRISYPFALLVLYPIVLFKKKNSSHLFFFFDRYSIGGAQRVHLDILASVADVHKKVYFTRKSKNRKLKTAFYCLPNSDNYDIHFYCDNLLIRLFSVHFFAFYINLHPHATVFSSNSTFFYDMLPFFYKKVYNIDLLHNFTYGQKGMEFFGLANYRYLEKRLVIDRFTQSSIQEQYKKYKIDDSYFNKVQIIEFGVNLPGKLDKDYDLPLRVLYAGRGGPQKRVWLIDEVARFFIDQRSPVEFHFAGTMLNELSEKVKLNSILHGEISDEHVLNEIYRRSHVILLTSAYEGFPVFIKEGMAYGCIPIVTALEGNKTHLKHLQNALLIDTFTDERKVASEGILNIKMLISQPDLIVSLSQNAYTYARENFGKENFMKAYRNMLLELH